MTSYQHSIWLYRLTKVLNTLDSNLRFIYVFPGYKKIVML